MMDALFKSHKLTPAGQGQVEHVKLSFDMLLDSIKLNIAGSGRYEAMVKTKLEEACMMAVKAVAVQPSNQEH